MITTTDHIYFYANYQTPFECELIHLVMDAYQKGKDEKDRIVDLHSVETGDLYIEFEGTTEGKALLEELKHIILICLKEHDEIIKAEAIECYKLKNNIKE